MGAQCAVIFYYSIEEKNVWWQVAKCHNCDIVFQKCHILCGDFFRHLHAVRAPAVAHQVGHPVDEHRGLARTGSRQQQQGALGGQHRLLLLRVQRSVIEGNGIPPQAAEFLLLMMCQHEISPSII